MLIELLKLGTMVTDKDTELTGMLTHYQSDGESLFYYLFQPKGLNKETGEPIKSMWVREGQIMGAKEVMVDLPLEMIGTACTDKASGFKGVVKWVDLHINGCIHASLLSKATTKTGELVPQQDFDIRRLKGSKVPKFTEPDLAKSIKDRPSPAGMPSSTVMTASSDHGSMFR